MALTYPPAHRNRTTAAAAFAVAFAAGIAAALVIRDATTTTVVLFCLLAALTSTVGALARGRTRSVLQASWPHIAAGALLGVVTAALLL